MGSGGYRKTGRGCFENPGAEIIKLKIFENPGAEIIKLKFEAEAALMALVRVILAQALLRLTAMLFRLVRALLGIED